MLSCLRNCNGSITKRGSYGRVGKFMNVFKVSLSSLPDRFEGHDGPANTNMGAKPDSEKPPSKSLISQFAVAVKRYRSLHPPGPDGLLFLPSTAVIKKDDLQWPVSMRGMRLGLRLQRFISKHANFHELHKQFRDVQVIGPPAKITNSPTPTDSVIPAIAVYRRINQVPAQEKAIISRDFVVPFGSPEWPSYLWGMRLGMKLNNMWHNPSYQKYSAQLRELVELTSKKRGRKAKPTVETMSVAQAVERFCLAVKTYRQLHAVPDGEVVAIPSTYIVPRDDPRWPEDMWDMKLGYMVLNVVFNGAFSRFQDQLAELHLPAKGGRVRSILEAVKAYKQLQGLGDRDRVAIPITFTVPEGDDRWPKESQGLNLGAIVRRIEACNAHIEHYEEFRNLGLFRKKRLKPVRIIQALQTYRRIHFVPEGERVQIPQDFVVPEGAEEWPQSMWGLKLGVLASNAIYSRSFEKMQPRLVGRLRELGLRRAWGPSRKEYSSQQTDHIVRGVEIYIAMHHPEAKRNNEGVETRRIHIPQNFVVPSDDPQWPEELWGMKLGIAVKNVLYHSRFPACRDKLYDLGVMRRSELPPDIVQVKLVQMPQKTKPRLVDA